MALEIENFRDPHLDDDYLTYLIDRCSPDSAGRYDRLWDYYRNPLTAAMGPTAGALNANSRPYFQAQEVGLPARITGVDRHGAGGERLTDLRRKEVVIENDIGWRVNTMVDFLFGKNVTIRSLAGDPATAEAIEAIVAALLDANGGLGFFQELALLGSVYGFVDIALRPPAGLAVPQRVAPRRGTGKSVSGRSDTPQTVADGDTSSKDTGKGPAGDRSKTRLEQAVATAVGLHLETVEAPRVLPILEENDYRSCRYWVQRFRKHTSRLARYRKPWLSLPRRRRQSQAETAEVVEIIGRTWWQRYEDRRLVAEGPNLLGRLPVVHVQNVALPGSYAGLSDVEPLIPLQDELNTRLSDRAHRVTYQSFKMYLGKGIDDFLERPVGPGQMWATQNPAASIEEFGSDSGSPSEDAHIDQTRQALDKVSGVTPLAAGLIRGNVGNLTSATALKVLLSGLLARTAKKRLTYGAGIGRVAELCLDWMDRVGVFATRPEDRRIEVHWPSPLPADEAEQLRNARIKLDLGVPADRVFAELGYDRQIANQPADK